MYGSNCTVGSNPTLSASGAIYARVHIPVAAHGSGFLGIKAETSDRGRYRSAVESAEWVPRCGASRLCLLSLFFLILLLFFLCLRYASPPVGGVRLGPWLIAHICSEPGSGISPPRVGGARRDIEDRCCFLYCEPDEVTQHHELSDLRVFTPESLERLIKSFEVCIGVWRSEPIEIETNAPSARAWLHFAGGRDRPKSGASPRRMPASNRPPWRTIEHRRALRTPHAPAPWRRACGLALRVPASPPPACAVHRRPEGLIRPAWASRSGA